jgi:hypothetical protein
VIGGELGPTLACVPAVVAAFVLLARGVRRRGARPMPRGALVGEWSALAALVLAALGHRALALPWAPAVLYCGFVLLLLHHVAVQLLALRPLLGGRLPGRPSPIFFWIPFVVYLALMPWAIAHRPPDGDEPYYLLITHSLAHDFDADLTDDYAAGEWRHFMDRPIAPQPGDPRGPQGEMYSRHNELLPLALTPAYAVAGLPGALATMAAFTAALAWMVLRLAGRYFARRPGEALAAYAIAAFSPPLLLYSYQVWVEVPAALLATIALDRVLAPEGWGWKKWLGVGLPILLLPLLKIRLILLAGPLLAMAWLYAGRPRRPLVVIGVLLAILGGGILAYNQWTYGNPLKVHSLDEAAFYRQPLAAYARGFLGFFFDGAFGLFAAAPIWMLLLPAVGVLLRRRGLALGRHLLVFAVPYLILVAPRSEWYGGWSPPFRYALVTLPLCAVALVPLLVERRRAGARFLLAGLGALSLAVTLLWLALPGWTYSFADGRTLLLDQLSVRFGADVARLFPSSVRPRPATWVWPVMGGVLLPAVFWGIRRRARGAAAAGLAAAVACLGLLPLAAQRLPTRTLELEDPYVRTFGGHLEPERWTFDRTRFRGAWVLREGEHLAAPAVAGGRRATLVLEARFVRHHAGPLVLAVRCGERLVGELVFDRLESWESRSLGPVDWSPGAPLVLAVVPSGRPGRANGILLDRVRFAWQ